MPRRLTCDNGPSDPDAHSPNQLRSTENARTRVSRFEGQPPRTRSRRSACHTRPRTLDRRRRRCRRGGQVLWRRCSRSACRRCARFNTGATVGAGDGGGVCGGGSGLLGGAGGVDPPAGRAPAAATSSPAPSVQRVEPGIDGVCPANQITSAGPIGMAGVVAATAHSFRCQPVLSEFSPVRNPGRPAQPLAHTP